MVGTAPLKLMYFCIEQAKLLFLSYMSNRKSGNPKNPSRIFWNAIGVSNGVSVPND